MDFSSYLDRTPTRPERVYDATALTVAQCKVNHCHVHVL